MRLRISYLTALATFLLPGAPLGATLHVPAEYGTIQAAIDAATDGDTVQVACGTYNEHDIVMKSGICLRSETGEAACATIDAQAEGRVLYCADVDSTSRIEGFTITGGLITGTGCANSGAGIYCERSSPAIAQCDISSNSGSIEAGGALACCDGCSPILTDVILASNSGGAASFGDCSPMLLRVKFLGNTDEWGGGIACSYSTVTLTECEFTGNTAGSGYGGGIYAWYSSLELTDVVFSGNSAGIGGAMYLDLSSSDQTCCTFSGNSAIQYGGAIACAFYGPATRLAHCTLYGNWAGYYGGGVYCIFDYNLVLDNTIIAFSTQGEAVSLWDRSRAVATCTDIYGNAGGDWTGGLMSQLGVNGNFSACPLFCDPDNDDFSLQECSPCVPGNHPTGDNCGLIGISDVGCECGLPSTVERRSWGAVKAMYR